MAQSNNLFLLTVRGTLKDPAKARAAHNQTAGSEQGIAGARALGDLSHQVFVPATAAGPMAGATADEVLFMDFWTNPQGIQEFFGNPQVAASADLLFKSRTPTVWAPAEGFASVHLPPARSHTGRYIGVLAGTIKSKDAAAVWSKQLKAGLPAARRLGFFGRESFLRLDPSGASSEFLSIDRWGDLKGMAEFYRTEITGELMATLSGAPTTSIWEQPSEPWTEW